MEYRILGRTNLKASIMSLGTGGHSRIGQSTRKTREQSRRIIRKAIYEGINLIDTAEAYGTEEIVGEAISDIARDDIIISTKASLYNANKLKTPEQIQKSLEESLIRLGTDHVDIYHLHAVRDKDYDFAVREYIPKLFDLKKQGKLNFIGITEEFGSDRSHKMMKRAIQDDFWDVIMTGFNFLNQSARDSVIIPSVRKNIGILDMFAVRRVLTDKEKLLDLLKKIIDSGQIDIDRIDLADPLKFLFHKEGCRSFTEAAYRFCISEPGIHSVLSGTGDENHLIQNIQDISKGPLPEEDRTKLISIFENVDNVSGD